MTSNIGGFRGPVANVNENLDLVQELRKENADAWIDKKSSAIKNGLSATSSIVTTVACATTQLTVSCLMSCDLDQRDQSMKDLRDLQIECDNSNDDNIEKCVNSSAKSTKKVAHFFIDKSKK